MTKWIKFDLWILKDLELYYGEKILVLKKKVGGEQKKIYETKFKMRLEIMQAISTNSWKFWNILIVTIEIFT